MSWLGGPLPERYVDYDVYTDDELYQPDWPEYEDGGYSEWDSDSDTTTWGTVGDANWVRDYMTDTFGGPGTQQVGAPSAPPRSFSFSDSVAPLGSYGRGSGAPSGGPNRIGSWYVDPGMGDYLAQKMIDQKYTPLQRTWLEESYGPAVASSSGGSSSGSSLGNKIANTAIDFLGGFLSSQIG